jgi:hypothetical protein
MEQERQSDLIMATALAKTLAEVVGRLDQEICEPSTLRELRRIADRAQEALEQAA